MNVGRCEHQPLNGRGRSVRAHLAAIVIAMVVVLVVVGALLGRQTWQNSKTNGRANAASMAALVAQAMDRSQAVARDQVVAIAANPAVVPMLADPSDCTLEFNLEPFSGAHIDIIRSGGEIVCSSAQLPANGATQATDGWLDAASTEPGVVSDVFTDGVSGLPAVALSASILEEGRDVGTVAIVMPTGEIARTLTDTFGGDDDLSDATKPSRQPTVSSRHLGDDQAISDDP